MRIRVFGSGTQGGQAYSVALLRTGRVPRIDDRRAYPFEWEFAFDGTKDDILFLRSLKKEDLGTTDFIDRVEQE